MDEEMQLFAMSDMQREAFANFIDDFPLVIRSLQHRYPADQVCERAMVMQDMMEQFCVPKELTQIDRAILKAAIEDNDWLEPYEGQSEASKARRPRQLEVLRECAKRLEGIGIEVDRMPA
ncbi:hypothetical protein [Erythrobacter sp. SD-21]|uniref:hypothetical protein n=1 Tax=Erythrobacter sp. SD-21 TaxID=161528 RepID=UPI000153F0C2|nr:hypothetical protein [Erythrobacter sp. SD-21]EDL48248.1 hypothetical protein ED21_31894 [Erythrobacter sp. SD-21]